MKVFAPHGVDGYKLGHADQYPVGTEMVYSNNTPRSNRLFKGSSLYDGKLVAFGPQGGFQEIVEYWNESFFSQPKEKVIARFTRRVNAYLGEGVVNTARMAALHDLGFLPIRVKTMPEGTRINMKIPLFTVMSTFPEFFWVTNYLETIMSNMTWKQATNATIAGEYRKLANHYAEKTGFDLNLIQFQCHDFSMRGMSGLEDAIRAASGHSLFFSGTDTFAVLDYLEDYYGVNTDEELVGCSVAATEHAVSSSNILFRMARIKQKMALANIREGDLDARLEAEVDFMNDYITRIVPTGIASYVADTYDYWGVLTKILPRLKDIIMARDGKLVIRPDSGDPLKVICGDPDAEPGSPEFKGSLQILWETFGGTITETGHKLLDSHIGLIYGDSITLQRFEAILKRMEELGFSSGCAVFGIGSYTYQMNTRDTFGFAVKATACTVNGEFVEIYKDPATGDGLKKSAKGLLRVDLIDGEYVLKDQCTFEEERGGVLKLLFENGRFWLDDLQTIKGRLA
jgi:nicotinamide phosphoribosyltransferase